MPRWARSGSGWRPCSGGRPPITWGSDGSSATSSWASRSAACSGVSPGSIRPPGKLTSPRWFRSACDRRVRSTSAPSGPSYSGTRTAECRASSRLRRRYLPGPGPAGQPRSRPSSIGGGRARPSPMARTQPVATRGLGRTGAHGAAHLARAPGPRWIGQLLQRHGLAMRLQVGHRPSRGRLASFPLLPERGSLAGSGGGISMPTSLRGSPPWRPRTCPARCTRPGATERGRERRGYGDDGGNGALLSSRLPAPRGSCPGPAAIEETEPRPCFAGTTGCPSPGPVRPPGCTPPPSSA